MTSFVRAYGLPGATGDSSVTANCPSTGSPYREADDEKTMRCTPWRSIEASRSSVLPTLFS